MSHIDGDDDGVGYGVRGRSHVDGVRGESDEGKGVVGHSNGSSGVYGHSNGSSSVYGHSDSGSPGVYGQSTAGAGVYGTGDAGVHGHGYPGVKGTSSLIGVYGSGNNGVEGHGDQIGVWGLSPPPTLPLAMLALATSAVFVISLDVSPTFVTDPVEAP
jgi:hypothetical protein